jgi:hypothetical protein
VPSERTMCEFQAVGVENSMKLLQLGESSSFLKSTKLERGGNHDSIVWLRVLPLVGAILDCCGGWGASGSGERSTSLPPLDKIASTDTSLALIVDDLRLATRSADGRGGEAKESSSSSLSLILMKFN